jgi:tetratricopeptide (TPR) repeat protein
MRTLRAPAAALVFVLLLPLLAAAQAALPPFDQGRVYAREADFQRAIQPYQAAISADARNARAHYWLGLAYLYAYRQYRGGLAPYAAGYLPRAVASLRQAVQADGSSIPALTLLANALFLQGDDEEAQALMERAARQARPPGAPYTIPPG